MTDTLVRRFLAVWLLTCVFTGLAYLKLDTPALGVDDAHIFFIYGRHVADGEGFVYNVGGEVVEGFTSLAWTLIITAVYFFTGSPEIPLLCISISLISFAIAYIWQYIEVESSALRGILFLVFIYSSPGFIIWNTLTLMDTVLWTTLLVMGTITALKATQPRVMSIVIALMLLTRPEAMVWGIALLIIFATRNYLQSDVRTAWKQSYLPLLTYFITLLSLTCWRLLYFGFPLPNTYYAKMSSDIVYNLTSGFIYAMAFLWANPLIVACVGISLAIVLLNVPWLLRVIHKPSHSQAEADKVRCILYASLTLLAFLVPVGTGGDHFGLMRFYQPAWPVFFLPILFIWDKWPGKTRLLGVYGFVIIFILSLMIVPTQGWNDGELKYYIRHEFSYAAEGEEIGRLLNKIHGDPPKVAVVLAGGIANTYHGEIFDTMGLNNTIVAHTPGERHGLKNHAAFNPELFLQENPDLFISFYPVLNEPDVLVQQWNKDKEGENDLLKGLFADKQFLETYQLSIIHFNNTSLRAFINRQYLGTLLEQGIKITPVLDNVAIDQP